MIVWIFSWVNFLFLVLLRLLPWQRHTTCSDFLYLLLYHLRALDKIFEHADEFEGVTPNELVSEGRAWIRKFPSDENYAEVLYLIARAYLKDGIASDAKYMLDILMAEHEKSKFTKLAMLDYADYLYRFGKQKEAMRQARKEIEEAEDEHHE